MIYSGQQYLRAEHLMHGGKYIAAKVIISGVVADCPIKRGDKDGFTIGLAFEKSDKVLGLNRTNYSQCCWELGEGKPEHWIGGKITLVVRLVRNRKYMEPAIRVWTRIPNPCVRVRDQLGEEITAAWYAENSVVVDAKSDDV